ncbi:uncharacterized protein LOC124118953 [Haliotis rufescens]|uniref:uncharacterized protein LOC124118953 n=1 Tax=Haliotis rufescens TaxID=6454 RepID=UPI00201F2873|nr:uncharacterized protein LOC124118953 [Haliotis rufescens]
MTSFEVSALSTAPFQPLCWYRKVDDTFTTIAHPNDPTELLKHRNAQHHRIQFTVETETNQHLPFIKQAIIATLTRRAKSICHPDVLSSEMDHLKETFTSLNSYPAYLHPESKTIRRTLKNSDNRLKPAPSPSESPYPTKALSPIRFPASSRTKPK